MPLGLQLEFSAIDTPLATHLPLPTRPPRPVAVGQVLWGAWTNYVNMRQRFHRRKMFAALRATAAHSMGRGGGRGRQAIRIRVEQHKVRLGSTQLENQLWCKWVVEHEVGFSALGSCKARRCNAEHMCNSKQAAALIENLTNSEIIAN